MASARKASTRYRVLKEIVCEAIPEAAFAPMIDELKRKKNGPIRPKRGSKKPRKKSDE